MRERRSSTSFIIRLRPTLGSCGWIARECLDTRAQRGEREKERYPSLSATVTRAREGRDRQLDARLLDLVVAKLVHHLAGRLRVPAKIAAGPVVDVRPSLRRSPVGVRRLATPACVARWTGPLPGTVLQHAILRLRCAPVHRLYIIVYSIFLSFPSLLFIFREKEKERDRVRERGRSHWATRNNNTRPFFIALSLTGAARKKREIISSNGHRCSRLPQDNCRKETVSTKRGTLYNLSKYIRV